MLQRAYRQWINPHIYFGSSIQVDAPYLRLKNSKKTSNVKVLVNWGPFGEKKMFEKSLNAEKKTERAYPLGFFNINSVAKLQKLEGGPLGFFRKKISQSRKN